MAKTIATTQVHIRVANPGTGTHGFARLHVSDTARHDILAAQGYILRNAGVREGDTVEVEIWDQQSQAHPADILTLREINAGPVATSGPDDARAVRQRLTDSGLTVLAGHRFSLPIRDGEATFEVVAATPSAVPVRCTAGTEVTVIDDGTDRDLGSTARPAPAPETAVFADVGGLDEAIQRIAEIVVWPAEYPELFARLGIRTARGVILHGPPGNGKTLLARSVAQRLGAHFFAINGPEILSKFYGETEQRLRKVFEDAVREQPSVVFLDELDSIAPSRDNVSGDLEVRLVSQLLTLMDGLTHRGQVIVIGATNRPSAIDPALRRPGRFDHEVEIGPPDLAGRRAILEVHTRGIPLDGGVDLDAIAEVTVGYVGADLASLCQEAAMAAARRALAARGAEAAMPEPSGVSVTHADFSAGLRTVQPSAFRQQRQVAASLDWDDIVGLDGAKRALTELVDWPLTRAADLRELGIDQGGGIALCGPAMSGKTALVAALAKRVSASLIYVPSVELLHPWAGHSEAVIRKAFVEARHGSPSIVLIDNFEQLTAAGPETARRVLAQVNHELAQMRLTTSVFVVVTTREAATDDPLFSAVVHVDRPTRADAELIIERRLSPHLDADVSIDQISAGLDGLPMGQILRVCNEALMCALWEDSEKLVVGSHHVTAALARVGRTAMRSEEG